MSLPQLPPQLASLIADCSPRAIAIGESRANVFHLKGSDKAYYLKIAPTGSDTTLRPEYDRIHWLNTSTSLPVPEAVCYDSDERGEYLLLTEVGGKMSCDPHFSSRKEQMVRSLAKGIKMLQEVDISNCPFNMTLDQLLPDAKRRVDAGEQIDGQFKKYGHTPATMLKELMDDKPPEELVFTHGDYCLPNILLDEESCEVKGFIDLGSIGVSDGYRDISLCIRSFKRNWGDELVPLLLKELGFVQRDKKDTTDGTDGTVKGKAIDWDKVGYYLRLDKYSPWEGVK